MGGTILMYSVNLQQARREKGVNDTMMEKASRVEQAEKKLK